MLRCFACFFLFIANILNQSVTTPNSDRICGKWMSAEKNLTVLVYKSGDQFKAKIIWFRDDPSLPMGEWRDKNNPDPALRSRKILGMEILRDIKYDADGNSWEGGMIYDAKHGREWNASAYINKEGLLKVKGYWHFKFIGRTMTFHRE